MTATTILINNKSCKVALQLLQSPSLVKISKNKPKTAPNPLSQLYINLLTDIVAASPSLVVFLKPELPPSPFEATQLSKNCSSSKKQMRSAKQKKSSANNKNCCKRLLLVAVQEKQNP